MCRPRHLDLIVLKTSPHARAPPTETYSPEPANPRETHFHAVTPKSHEPPAAHSHHQHHHPVRPHPLPPQQSAHLQPSPEFDRSTCPQPLHLQLSAANFTLLSPQPVWAHNLS